MKRFLIDNLADVACSMYENITEKGFNNVMFAGHYKDASTVIKELLMYDETIPYNITIKSGDWDSYHKEYYVTLDENMNIWCNEAYDFEYERYLYDTTQCLYVADDCNSALLKKITCNEDNIYEVSYDGNESDYECNGNCACCKFAEKDDSDDKHEVVTRVAVDNDGVIRGFEKTWETKEGNMTYHSTYTHYSNNTELLKQLMENFDIKF